MTIEQVIPKTLDTPQKRKEWLKASEQIRKQKEYVRFYRHEITLAKRNLMKAEKELKELREWKQYIEQGKPKAKPHIGYQKFEEEE